MKNFRDKLIQLGLGVGALLVLFLLISLRNEAEAVTLMKLEDKNAELAYIVKQRTVIDAIEEVVIDEPIYKETTMYSVTELNVRKGPSTEFDVEKVLPLGEEVIVYTEEGQEDNGWSLIDLENELYVSTSYLGTKEDFEKVKEARQKALDEKKKKEDEAKLARTRKEQNASFTMNTSTSAHTGYLVKSNSGLSVDQINQKLSSYPGLAGLGYAIKDIENNYGVNAYFTMAVASHESGYGTSNLAINNNNLFGFKNGNKGWAYFNSKGEAIYRFGATISKGYFGIGLITPASINPKYCPNDGGAWASKVVTHMSRYM